MSTPSNAPVRKVRPLTKGIVAGTLGFALLASSVGTFATWQDDYTFPGAEVMSGQLSLETVEEGAWTLNNFPVDDVAPVAMVPGDTLVYTETVAITAVGAGLAAEIVGTMPEFEADEPVLKASEVSGSLPAALDVTWTAHGYTVTDGEEFSYPVKMSGQGDLVDHEETVRMEIYFNPTKAEGTQKQTAVLADATVWLKQVLPEE